jgi:hypothetical protein
MITPALVARIGAVDSVVCHTDVDGLYAAAKWIRGGVEPYPGADDDARAIDTRIGEASSPLGGGRPRAAGARARRGLPRAGGGLPRDMPAGDVGAEVREAAVAYAAVEAATRGARGALRSARRRGVVRRDRRAAAGLRQDRPAAARADALPVSVVVDAQNVTLAAAFDSGINFLTMLGVGGGMPTRVSVPRSRLDDVRAALRRGAKGLPPEGERG